jgi:hypothetical protein
VGGLPPRPPPPPHPISQLIRGHFILRRRNRYFFFGVSFMEVMFVCIEFITNIASCDEKHRAKSSILIVDIYVILLYFFQENLFQMLPGCPDYATGKQYVFSLIGLTFCWILCKSCCYIRVDFTLAASQNGVCTEQEMCHIHC